jgi:hypothetical protein
MPVSSIEVSFFAINFSFGVRLDEATACGFERKVYLLPHLLRFQDPLHGSGKRVAGRFGIATTMPAPPPTSDSLFIEALLEKTA